MCQISPALVPNSTSTPLSQSHSSAQVGRDNTLAGLDLAGGVESHSTFSAFN